MVLVAENEFSVRFYPRPSQTTVPQFCLKQVFGKDVKVFNIVVNEFSSHSVLPATPKDSTHTLLRQVYHIILSYQIDSII